MSKKYALCIGINTYLSAQHLNLQFARQDAEELAGILGSTLCGNFDEVKTLFDESATKESIRAAIDDLLLSPHRQSDDLVIIFFSGHGTKDKQDDLCLIPTDYRYYSNDDIDFSSLIHVKELEISIGNSNVQNIILFIDCCYAGAVTNVTKRIKLSEESNLFLIGAARVSEKATELSTIQHGIFTECLLRAMNSPPDQGEWISIGRIISYISDEIKYFETGQLIQSTNCYTNLGIPITRNPSYSLSSSTFTNDVIKSFELGGYDTKFSQGNFSLPNFFIAKTRNGFRHTQTGVLCLDNRQSQVTDAHIQQFLSLIQQLHITHEIADGMLITYSPIQNKLLGKIDSCKIADYSTNENLLHHLIDFSRYLQKIIDEFELSDNSRSDINAIKNFYVELEVEYKDSQDRLSQGEAVNHIKKLVFDTGRSTIALLGEYGAGKTTLCKKLAYDLALTYIAVKSKKNRRIPIIIPLNEFPKGQADIEVFLTGHLAKRCKVNNPSFEAFKVMNDAGLLFLIFDGFDEMATYVDEDTIYVNLMQIEKLGASQNSRILLTSRPEYFKTHKEEQHALQPQGVSYRNANYEKLYLQPFGDEQIKLFLQKRIPAIPNIIQDWSYYYNEINRIHDLSDLSKRPVLLEMIVTTLPELIVRNQPIDRPLLYSTYLETELKRQMIEKRRELLIKRNDRLRMMQTLALHFYFEYPSGLTADLVQILVHDQMTSKQREELESYTRDFLTCSFLARHGDVYTFSHRSIVEYLTAKALLNEIELDTPNWFSNRILTKEVLDFLVEFNPSQSTLIKWLENTRYRDFETAQYLGSNAITLLNMLKMDFSKRNLAGIVIRGASLNNAIFYNAIFAQSDLTDVVFSNSDLTGCNFMSANLANTKFNSAILRESSFCEACLDYTDLTGADISGTDFSRAICYQTNCNEVIVKEVVKGFNLNGIINASSSLILQIADLNGDWQGQRLNSTLTIFKKTSEEIKVKLLLSETSWIDLEGKYNDGKYYLIGSEYKVFYKISSENISNRLDKKIPQKNLTDLEKIEGELFKNRSDFFNKIRSIIGIKHFSEFEDKKIENIIKDAQFELNSYQCKGWLMLSSDPYGLMLHLEGGSIKSKVDNPWIFAKSLK